MSREAITVKYWRGHMDGPVRHAWPVGDMADHDLSDDCQCECGPRIEMLRSHIVVIHNSFDARELRD